MIERASELGGMDHLTDALHSFRCCKDEDIETFLRYKAFEYLERCWCSIYLILDEEAFDKGKIEVVAYFTLSHKSLLPENASKTKVKEASGFKTAESIHFVLIGQLGKYMAMMPNDCVRTYDISGQEVLDYALEVIQASNQLIPCRCVLVECSEKEKVQKFYTDYGFSFFQYDGEHYQFYKRI